MKTMKFIAVLAVLSLSMGVMCQTNVPDPKLQKKIEKEAKKKAKKMMKEGWKTTGMPLEKQLYRYYAYMYDSDENGSPNYFMGTGQSAMNNYDAARMQATELARSEIARNVDQMVIGFIENTIGDEHDAIITILTELHCSSLNSERMSIIAVVEAYRDLPDKNREVQMRIVLKEPVSKVMYKFKSALPDELRKRGLKLSEKTMKLLEKKSVENDINEISKKVSE